MLQQGAWVPRGDSIRPGLRVTQSLHITKPEPRSHAASIWLVFDQMNQVARVGGRAIIVPLRYPTAYSSCVAVCLELCPPVLAKV